MALPEVIDVGKPVPTARSHRGHLSPSSWRWAWPGLPPLPRNVLLCQPRPVVATLLAGAETSPLAEAPTECLRCGLPGQDS